MKNNTFFKTLLIMFVIAVTAIITNVCYGASIVINAGSTDLTVGSATTLTISGNDIAGKVSITSSNPGVIALSTSEEWLDGTVTVRATAKSAGSAYITVRSIDTSSASTGEPVSAAAGANITAKEIVNTTIIPQTANNRYITQNSVVDTRSSNNYLSSLSVEGYEISPAFNADTNNYTMNVKSDVSELKLSAIPADNNSKVVVDGNLDLVSGDNNVTVTVTAENGYKRVYTIVVTKEKDPNDIDATISKLVINNAKIKGVFSPEVLEYMCDDISADISKLDIEIETNVPDLKYEITGNEELKSGINHITIKITSRDGSETKEYKIIVYKTDEVLALKEVEEEMPQIEQSTSFIDKIKEKKKLVLIGGIVFLLVIIIVILKKKRSNNKNLSDEWLKSNEEDFENKKNKYVNEELEGEVPNKLLDSKRELLDEEIESSKSNEEGYDTAYDGLNEVKETNFEDEFIIRTGSLASNKKSKKVEKPEIEEERDISIETEKNEDDKEEKKIKPQDVNIKLDLSSLKNNDDK